MVASCLLSTSRHCVRTHACIHDTTQENLFSAAHLLTHCLSRCTFLPRALLRFCACASWCMCHGVCMCLRTRGQNKRSRYPLTGVQDFRAGACVSAYICVSICTRTRVCAHTCMNAHKCVHQCVRIESRRVCVSVCEANPHEHATFVHVKASWKRVPDDMSSPAPAKQAAAANTHKVEEEEEIASSRARCLSLVHSLKCARARACALPSTPNPTARLNVYVNICMCMCLYIHIHIFICIYIYMYSHG